MSDKLVLIDGHSILNRAFYGVPDLTNSEGLHTNAVYGFLNIMFKIIEEEKPQYLIVAFDVKAPTFRHKIFKEYKGTRKPMPDELRQQVPVMKEVLQAMEIPIMEQAGLEADDILGTLAKQSEQKGIDVSLISGDRDLLQIATEHIKIRIPKTKGNKTEIEDYYAEDVYNKYQVTPLQFIELKALMGDAADNIPGIPKVGEKTATGLMVEYGSILNIYNHLEEITKKSIQESLEQNRELADLSKVLATIDINAPIEYNLEDARLGKLYTKEAYGFFKRLGFKNFLGRFEQMPSRADVTSEFHEIMDKEQAESVFKSLEEAKSIGFQIFEEAESDIKESGNDGQFSMDFSEVKGFFVIAITGDAGKAYCMVAGDSITKEYLLRKLTKTVAIIRQKNPGKNGEDVSSRVIVTSNVKACYPYFEENGNQGFFDIILAAYLLNPLKNDYVMADIANEYLQLLVAERSQLFGKTSLKAAYEEKQKEFCNYACYYAYVAYQVRGILLKQLKETGMEQLFNEMEMPLSYVLYDMTKLGIMVKPDELKVYGDKLGAQIQVLEQTIYGAAGETFNINSPKQMGEILFEKLQIPEGKKTKTGYSTAADVLEKLAPEYSIIKNILEYRGLSKLKSTYADGLAAYIGADMRIHSTFNQTITATGRISSTEPNLQNIPMRMELGRLIRKVFVPKENCVFVDADYSQIELRILAHMSGDEQLIEAYKSGKDIHRITASKVFHTPFEEVTDLQRRNAKAVNFGIVYGISSFGLGQDLNISRKEASEYIDHYFETYPKIKGFLDETVAQAKEDGYVTTMFGRRRPVPELSSSNFMQRSFGERVAMNSPIQGPAADIMKIAMLHVWEELKKRNLKSHLILQIHDELLIETVKGEEEIISEILAHEMTGAAKLAIELEIDLHSGNDWYEAK